MAVRDPYEVLGVERSATADEIKSAYRRLARRFHPDVNPNDPTAEDRFKEIGEAYSILSDSSRRERFDRFGTVEDVPQGDFFGGGSGGFGDLFEMFFGGMGGQGSRNPGKNGEDLQTSVSISLLDVINGCTRQVTYNRMGTCSACSGNGTEGGAEPDICDVCKGAGAVNRIQQTFLGNVRTSVTCHACGGSGRIIRNPCKTCGGKTRVSERKTIDVRVPPGVDDGVSIQFPGGGGDPIGFGRPGDLYVVVNVSEMDEYERDGRDLHKVFPITFGQAALGDSLSYQGIDQPYDIEVQAGSQPDDVLTIRGAGLPPLHGGRRGDLHLHLTVSVPKDLNEDQRARIIELCKALGEKEPAPKGSLLGGLFKRKK